MEKILISVDSFTERHYLKLAQAVNSFGEIERMPQDSASGAFIETIARAAAMVGWPDPKWLKTSSLRLLQIGSAGWDAYEQAGLKEHGIRLCTGKGIYSVGVAEHCIAMMMYFTRNFRIHVEDQKEHIFRRHEPYGELAGSKACIVGLGEIGMQLARRCRGLDMYIIGVDVHDKFSHTSIDQYCHAKDVVLAVSQADHVFATLPGGVATKKFFNSNVLSALGVDAFFYNVSRGTTVDQDFLFSLLAERKIGGAGLDVAEKEPLPANSRWWNLDNVLITGHSAGLSAHWPDRFCDLAAYNLKAFFEGRPLKNEIDFKNRDVR